MDQNSTYDQIEAYLLHKMSNSERTKFERELATNQELAQQFKAQELEHKMMEALVEKDLRKDLKQWQTAEDAIVKTPPTEKNITAPIPLYRRKSSWAIAASILLLVSAFFLFNKNIDNEPSIVDIEDQPKPPTEQPIKEVQPKEEIVTNDSPSIEKEDLVEEAPKNTQPKIEKLNPPPTTPTVNYIALADTYSDPIKFETNVRGTSDENTYKEALSYLDKGELNLGITKLSELLNTTPNDNIRYNLALAYYQQKKFDQAIPFFSEVISNEYFHIDQAQWFLALAYLQVGAVDKAKEILLAIKEDGDHPKFKEALGLWGELHLRNVE